MWYCPSLRCVVPRCAALSRVNSLLREQLEQAGTVSHGLAESLCKAREDAEMCDTRLRKEQEVREKPRKNEVLGSEKQKGKRLHFIPLRTEVVQLNPLRVHMG